MIKKNNKNYIGNKNGRGNLGKPKSEQHKNRIKEARKKQVGDNSPNWKGGFPDCIDCGKKVSFHKKNVRCRKCFLKFTVGEKHWSWKGGINDNNPYPKEFSKELKLKIRQRDNFICCVCGRTEREELEELNRVLCVNHIDFNKNNCKESNLNTLCLRCNVKINRERDYWTNYFNNQ